jgi:hypothetical protein
MSAPGHKKEKLAGLLKLRFRKGPPDRLFMSKCDTERRPGQNSVDSGGNKEREGSDMGKASAV